MKLKSVLVHLVCVLAVALVAPPIMAAEEICNSKDDDLDGLVDEDFPMVGKDCWSGIGVCRQQGKWQCNGEFVVCNPGTFIFGTDEACNGLDDDCNGVIDDMKALPTCYIETDVNMCNQGRFMCTTAGEYLCVPVAPTEEVCGNDIDEDCDGVAPLCLPDPTTSSSASTSSGGMGGGDGSGGGLGEPCRPVYVKEGTCSLSPTSHPLLPLSALLTIIGGIALAYRRSRLR